MDGALRRGGALSRDSNTAGSARPTPPPHTAPAHPLLQVRHLDLWAYNAYPGKNFTAFNWDAYAAYVKKPLLISEYGIDAYDRMRIRS